MACRHSLNSKGEPGRGFNCFFLFLEALGATHPVVFHHVLVQPVKIVLERLIELVERIKDAVTDLLEKPLWTTPMWHSPEPLSRGFGAWLAVNRKAHVIGKVTVGGIYVRVAQIGPVTWLWRLSTTT